MIDPILGIGLITAPALAATVPDATIFRSAREFVAWLGLRPKRNSTAGTDGLDRVTKQGVSYLRYLLDIGTRKVVRHPKGWSWAGGGCIEALLELYRPMVVAIALPSSWPRMV
ncbi:transposase [Bradyrhizobium ottawaense]|uniref:transposase n=1 Tax=Bradyrhizobium ottawaense TaxID=931866 RepID=UPI0035113204